MRGANKTKDDNEMIDTMGIIVTNDERIPPISDKRAVAALPIAGRYRIIDFVLSGMSNAGITNVGVVTKANYLSLMDHIKSGKPWDLDRKKQGLNVLPPNVVNETHRGFAGNIDMLEGVRDYIRRSDQTYVILSMGDYIYNIDFEKICEAHVQSQADVTVVYKDLTGYDEKELSRFTLFDMAEDGRITDIEVKPYYPKTAYAGMDLYIMEKALLESIIDECSARGDHDFVKDALAKKLGGLRIYGYKFDGFCDKIDSLKAYYKSNMDFLDNDVRTEIFHSERPVFTKTKDQSPTKYGENAVIKNSFISDGCLIEGRVENSVLSRGVKIAKGAVVRNCIIMQDSVIDSDVTLDHVVFDKEVHITEGRRLIGQKSYPLAIAKGTVI